MSKRKESPFKEAADRGLAWAIKAHKKFLLAQAKRHSKPAACPECERSFGPHYKGECEHG